MLDDLGVCVWACGATLSLFLAAALRLTDWVEFVQHVLCENADGGPGEIRINMRQLHENQNRHAAVTWFNLSWNPVYPISIKSEMAIHHFFHADMPNVFHNWLWNPLFAGIGRAPCAPRQICQFFFWKSGHVPSLPQQFWKLHFSEIQGVQSPPKQAWKLTFSGMRACPSSITIDYEIYFFLKSWVTHIHARRCVNSLFFRNLIPNFLQNRFVSLMTPDTDFAIPSFLQSGPTPFQPPKIFKLLFIWTLVPPHFKSIGLWNPLFSEPQICPVSTPTDMAAQFPGIRACSISTPTDFEIPLSWNSVCPISAKKHAQVKFFWKSGMSSFLENRLWI